MFSSHLENMEIPSTGDNMLTKDFQNLDEFFQIADWSQFNTTIASSTLLDKKFICQKELGYNVYLRAQVYKKCVKIHIRKFLNYKDSMLMPTTDGVCFNLSTFFRLFEKISDFNLQYTHASFVANNTLLVLNDSGKCIIQDMKSPKYIILDFYQVQTLKTEIYEFAEKLLNFLFVEYLPILISMEIAASATCVEENLTLNSRLITCIETEVSYNVLKKEFICEGCAVNRPSQNHHTCMNMRDLHKFQRCGQYVLMCVNFDSIVQKFKKQTIVITEDFVSQFNLDFIVDALFKTPEDF